MVPGLDMLRIFFQRLSDKKNPFKPDKMHLHHYLLERYGYKSSISIITLILIFTYLTLYLNLSKIIIILSYGSIYIILITYLYSKKKFNN